MRLGWGIALVCQINGVVVFRGDYSNAYQAHYSSLMHFLCYKFFSLQIILIYSEQLMTCVKWTVVRAFITQIQKMTF